MMLPASIEKLGMKLIVSVALDSPATRWWEAMSNFVRKTLVQISSQSFTEELELENKYPLVWPCHASPQHFTVPFQSTAQECCPPRAMPATFLVK
jgi:hypothetical protein